MKWVLAASRDKEHSTCINQSIPVTTGDMIHMIVCCIKKSSQMLWKGHCT